MNERSSFTHFNNIHRLGSLDGIIVLLPIQLNIIRSFIHSPIVRTREISVVTMTTSDVMTTSPANLLIFPRLRPTLADYRSMIPVLVFNTPVLVSEQTVLVRRTWQQKEKYTIPASDPKQLILFGYYLNE